MPKGRPAKCPYCDSGKTRPKGYRETATMGRRKRRMCNECKRSFTLK